MRIDPKATANAVDRTLEKVERQNGEAWRLVAARSYDARIGDAWDALTNRERISRWFLPISGDFRVGGRYQLEGNAGGEIERCEAPRAVAVTWEMHGAVSWVTVTLAEEGERTRLTLEHVAQVPEAIWDQFGPGAVGIGWDCCLMGLGLHLATGAAIDPKEVEAWTASDEGRSFLGASSDAWATAAIAAGNPQEKARAAAQQALAFYVPHVPPANGGIVSADSRRSR